MVENDKTYFLPGDVVTLRQDIPNKPVMTVLKKETSLIKKEKEENNILLRGIKCRWFTTEGLLQEATFNTKDLIKI